MFLTINRNKTFIGNIAILTGGTALGRLVTILAAPVIARLFAPDDFGIASLAIALAVVLNSISSLRYESAIVLPSDRDRTIALSRLALTILVIFTLFLIVLTWLTLWFDLDISWARSLGGWSYIIPVAVFILGVGNILRRWAVREKRFKSMSVAKASNPTVTAASRIGLGAGFGSSVSGLLTGYLAGVTAELILIARSLENRPAALFRKTPGIRLKEVANRYRGFALFQSPTALLKAFSEQMPVILLGALFSPAVVGFFAIAHRLVLLPIGIIGRSVRIVFLQRAVEIGNQGRRIGPGLSKVIFSLALIGAPVFVTLYAYGEPFFSFLLGDRWLMSGRMVEVLSPLFFSMLVFSPTYAVFEVLEKQRILLVLQLIRTAALAGAFGYGGYHELDALDTLALFSGLGVATEIMIAAASLTLAYGKQGKLSRTDSDEGQ